jgi:hypothetical protein
MRRHTFPVHRFSFKLKVRFAQIVVVHGELLSAAMFMGKSW